MEEALKLLLDIKDVKVLCVGDIMLDSYIYGQATRISPEAPVPVVHVKKRLQMPGGVGNVVKNLGALLAHPYSISVTGNDYNAGVLERLFQEAGLPKPGLVRDEARPTSVKTRIIAGIQQVVRFDEENNVPLSGELANKIVSDVKALLPEVGAVALSDYGKGTLSDEVLRAVLDMARAAGKPVVVDPKGSDYNRYRGATLVTPNRAELSEAVGFRVETFPEIEKAGKALMARCGLDNILVTLSEDGMMLLSSADAGKEPVLQASLAREVFDVSGAGDTVVAVMAASMAVGASLALGSRLANMAAGVVVGKVGTATAAPEEIVEWSRWS